MPRQGNGLIFDTQKTHPDLIHETQHSDEGELKREGGEGGGRIDTLLDTDG